MKLISLFLISLSINLIAQQTYDNLKEEGAILRVGTSQEYKNLSPIKAYVSIGNGMSRIKVKKSRVQVVVPENDVSLYIRGKSSTNAFPLSVIKLTEKKKKLTALFIDGTSNKFNFVPFVKEELDQVKNIFHIKFLNQLENGYYAVFFRRKQQGNLQMRNPRGFTYKPFVFQVNVSNN